MSMHRIELRNRMRQLCQAFGALDCQPVEVLVEAYQLPLPFLQALCQLGLLVSQEDTLFCRSSAWRHESQLSLAQLMGIARGKIKLQPEGTAGQVPPAPWPGPSGRPAMPTLAASAPAAPATPTFGPHIRSRESLTMALKLTKARHLRAELRWYSSQPFSAVKVNDPDARHQSYEQEVFELDGHLYRILDLETHMLEALAAFFAGTVIETTVKRLHHD